MVSARALPGLTFTELKAGMLIGVSIMLGYGLQTMGLQTISSSQSAFITALYVPFVPLLQWLVLGRRPGLMPSIGIGLAFIGLMLLAGPEGGSLHFSEGELVTLVSAVAIAGEIILISRYAGQVDVRRVTVVQLATASLLAFLMIVPTQERIPDFFLAAADQCRGPGRHERGDPGSHELGAEVGLAHPRHPHLCRRTSMGRDRRAHRR